MLIGKYYEECAKKAIAQIEANGEDPRKYPELLPFIEKPKRTSKKEMKEDSNVIRGVFDKIVGERYAKK